MRRWFRLVCEGYVMEEHHIKLLVHAAECWDRALYARTECSLPGSELGYSDNGMPNVEAIAFPVIAATPYFVFVDGYDDQPYSAGPFHLRIDLH